MCHCQIIHRIHVFGFGAAIHLGLSRFPFSSERASTECKREKMDDESKMDLPIVGIKEA